MIAHPEIPRRSLARRLPGLALAAARAGAAPVPAAPPPPPVTPVAPAAPAPPAGLAPLPADLARPLVDLQHAAEEYRGLTFRRPVPAGVLGGAALRREVDRQVAEEMPPGALAALGPALKAFGLIPESLDLATYYPSLLSTQIAAFYDPERKYLAIVDLGAQSDEALRKELGAAFAERARHAVLVHELTHALQDQAFDMARFVVTDPLSDASAARLALVEGDATVTMMDFLMGTKIEDLPGAADLLGPALQSGGAGSPGFPGSKEIAAAPAWFRETLFFSYLRGLGFCLAVRQRGGQPLLDYAFAKDPPRSSEQVLHPEKWFGRRDDPVEIDLPDLAAALPGARRVAEGQLGEEGIRVLLAAPLGAAAAQAPAAGWGGDRFAVYERAGTGDRGRLLAWVTEWDAEADAARFLAAAGRLGAGWTARRTAPTRVVLTRGPWAAAEREAAVARLAASRSERPANRPIDLAALGIPSPAPADKGGPEKAKPGPADGARALPHLRGRHYTDPARGLALDLPEAGGPWRLQPSAAADALLEATSADGAVLLTVHDRGLAEPAASLASHGERLVRTIEERGGRLLRSGLAGGSYELEFEDADARTGPFHQRARLYLRGGRALVVAGAVAPAGWAARAAEIATFLDSFALGELPTLPPAAPSPRP